MKLKTSLFRSIKINPAGDTGFASGGMKCKFGALYFNSSSVLVDSFVHRNPPEPKAQNRYRKPYGDSANIKQKDMKETFWDNITERLTARPISQRNEVLFFADPHF